LGTDPIANGDDVIQSLATAVDFATTGTDQALTLASGFVAFGGAYQPPTGILLAGGSGTLGSWVKLGGAITRTGSTLAVTANTAVVVATLPAELRPGTNRERMFLCPSGVIATNSYARIIITNVGTVNVYFDAAGTWGIGGSGYVGLDNIYFKK
jgi:hypothetical protein